MDLELDESARPVTLLVPRNIAAGPPAAGAVVASSSSPPRAAMTSRTEAHAPGGYVPQPAYPLALRKGSLIARSDIHPEGVLTPSVQAPGKGDPPTIQGSVHQFFGVDPCGYDFYQCWGNN
ncbi:hypothetical protein PCASD_04292 [Puccinia coronata f. sp. avenae]|uniref:Uncharacterized protein n=1 Tax=Puccinia coronata f. sp. avenae TaxID=200324 RepID=A0A2N5VEU3_9BASI|nr:hypothetical protein PCASD_04292 [Puccinia coronata f. sp. avenae]